MMRRLWRPLRRWLSTFRWPLAGLAALVAVLACVLVIPQWLVGLELGDAARTLSAAERAKAINDVRATLLQGIAGAVILLSIYFTYRQLQTGREQLQTAQQGQVTERFTRAVDQLGSNSEDVQLGGIYALQQISRNSDEERGAIHEILAAYVRNQAPWTSRHDNGHVDVDAIPRLRERAPGVQAAMLALGRRATLVGSPLGLMGTNLQRLRLSDTDIPGGANLESVLFWRSSLINASLGHANLRAAKLGWTDLRHSYLDETDFREADLRRADLRHASLKRADLRRADLRGADLRDTKNLETANLEGARAGAKAKDETKWPDGFEWQTAGVVMMDP
jgi:Pentapeptide repeats (8 copies)